MKAVFAVLAPAILLAAPSFANASQDVLKSSLANATRQKMSVAPWLRISVAEVVRGDKLMWVATTSGKQRYACASQASADALLSGDQVVCARISPSRAQLAANKSPNYAVERKDRAGLPYPGQSMDGFLPGGGIEGYRPPL